MFKFLDRTIEHLRCINQSAMCEFVNESMHKFTGQCLRHGDGRQISVRQNQRGFGVKERSELRFKLRVNLMVAGGTARGGDIKAMFCKRRMRRLRDLRIAGEPEIITAGKIEQHASAQAHFIVTDKFQRVRLGPDSMIIWEAKTARRICASRLRVFFRPATLLHKDDEDEYY